MTSDKGRITTTARIALRPDRAQEHRASVEVLSGRALYSAHYEELYCSSVFPLPPSRDG
jgi:hypothetical protein